MRQRPASKHGDSLIRGLKEAVSVAKGKAQEARSSIIDVPTDIDVRAIRERLDLSQEEFAMLFGFSLGTLRHWEQGRRYPDGAARTFLMVIDRDPDAVRKALAVG